MIVSNFLDIPNIQEVQCTAHGIFDPEVELLSLTLFRVDSRGGILSTLNTVKQSCRTFTFYSSCVLDKTSSKKSSVNILLEELIQGQLTEIGCNATMLSTSGPIPVYSTVFWSTMVYGPRR